MMDDGIPSVPRSPLQMNPGVQVVLADPQTPTDIKTLFTNQFTKLLNLNWKHNFVNYI